MSKKDEELKNLTKEIKGMKENKYYQEEIKKIKEQNSRIEEMLERSLSGAGASRERRFTK